MKGEHEESPTSSPTSKKSTLNDGLLIVPNNVRCMVKTVTEHRRTGSTGTTGDESYTTDDEEDIDEPDITIKDHVTRNLFNNHDPGTLGCFSDISTITDKVRHLSVMNRNSSDSSVYSDKYVEELGLDEKELCSDEKDHDSDNKSGASSSDRGNWTSPVVEVKEQSYLRLQNELLEANQELKLRDQELTRLNRMQQNVESELEDLTASLFQEAHNMVREANEKQAAAEKALKESQMKVDVLTAEVAALKTLVLTSTPSHPNPHLHPQIGNDQVLLKNTQYNCFLKRLKYFHSKWQSRSKVEVTTPRRDIGKHSVVLFTRKHHRRSPSHFNLKYGRENSPPDSPVKDVVHITSEIESKDGLEVDPVIHKEFLTWRQKPVLEKNDPFIQRIYEEDINLCLHFNNKDLTERVIRAVETGTIRIEAIGDKSKAMFPKKCALLEAPRLCFYRMNIGENDDWYNISQICRNRIIAVCDFLNYLKYIEGGLVKSSAHDVYWEIVRLRKNICYARLGLVLS